MIRLVLPILALLAGAAGGIAAGYHFAPDAPTDADADVPTDAEKEGEAEAGATEFADLQNQFVVPLVENGRVVSLVVLSLTVEVPAGETTAVLDREPKLRDVLLQVMFAHAGTGGFSDDFTSARQLSALRQNLREAARAILEPRIVRDVLILEIVRQEV